MRILVFHPVLWSHYKGIVFSQLSKQASRAGVRIHVAHVALTEKARASLGDVDRSVHDYSWELLSGNCLDEGSWFAQAWKAVAVAMRSRWDAVVLPGWSAPYCWAVLLACTFRRVPIIAACDSTRDDKPRVPWREEVKRLFLRQCRSALCYGAKSAEYLVDLGVPLNHIATRCQATDNERLRQVYDIERASTKPIFQCSSASRHFAYVGRLAREKNLRTLLEAWAQLQDVTKDWGLMLIGDGPERASLQQYCANLGLRDVHFVGGQQWFVVPRYLAHAEALVLPSISEPWGLVVNEAMVCGLPVVVSERCGCCPELVIPGVNGFRFPPNDSATLANHLRDLAVNDVLRERMGFESQRIIAEYTPANAARQMLSGIAKVVRISAGIEDEKSEA